ncbi:MAG: MarR family transcriptional regulator [Firmicutes bacterium]|nr:MarR family transcriptional regulator [Bacillota bacterium]
MLTPSLEDYLEETYRLCQEHGKARPSDLANRLNVSLPSVTNALKRLSADGYVDYQAYEEAALTERGREVGSYLATRNKVLRDFVSLLGVDCDVAEEVESMEHYLSPRVVMGIRRLLAYLTSPEARSAFLRFISTAPPEEPPPSVTQLTGIKLMRRFGGKVRRRGPPATRSTATARARTR